MSDRQARYLELDVLRGIAALVVVFSHYLPHIQRYAGDLSLGLEPAQWMEVGHYAVKLFFAISGFVIFLTLERCRSVLDFAVLRCSRLYPVYWTTLAALTIFGVCFFGQSIWWGGLAANATMFQEFLNVQHLDAVYWSLTVELAFYLNVAWLFALGLQRMPLRIVALWLSVACVWALTSFVFSVGNAQRSGWLAYLFALDYAPYFGLGIVFYQARRQGWNIAMGGLVALALLTEYLLFRIEGLSVAAAVTAIFAAADRGWLRGLVNPVTLWLGAISFPLYLVHRNLGFMFSLRLLEWIQSGLMVLAMTVIAALSMATLLTYYVEQPVMRAVRQRYFTRADTVRAGRGSRSPGRPAPK